MATGNPINPLFQVHKLNEDGLILAGTIAISFGHLLSDLIHMCPEGREFSIVKSKLEEACFYSKKAMASNPDNQEKV